MELFANVNGAEIVSTGVFVAIGLFCMIGCWMVIEWITPFSLREEIRQQNLAIAVLMGAVFIALAILIAAVIVS
ncbi:MAG: DUF350 domain-containing protein [Geminicoccaceae bacterium]